nr:immunoglobulin heavy chain junction region [Macaca mulatta]MOV90827.1 immunoglobulin heavy chain junction region [Macaca mulatta]MOV91228.1 immunoglobulin heavy chain junction region [Macaca mulatta]
CARMGGSVAYGNNRFDVW